MRFENDIIFFIDKFIINELEKCIENATPNEAFGLIFGEIQEINNNGVFKYKYYPVAFLIDNDDMLIKLATTILKNNNLKLIAFFHSHPAGASPSGVDKKCMKSYHNCGIKKFKHLIWIIMDSRSEEINGFIYIENKLLQIAINFAKD
jgi:proteasome lid subunit RPN8/RPN11